MSPLGHDANNCGARDHPCQSIVKAVHQVDCGGKIYLEGTGTKRIFYNCSVSEGHQGIYINKNLSIMGSKSHIFCDGGIHFKKSNGSQRMEFQLSGIVFWQTPLAFHDCHLVKIVNCSFHRSPAALSIQIASITTFQLEIQGFSYFHENSQCVEVLLVNNSENRNQVLNINVSDTYFSGNGFDDGQHTHNGGVMIATNKEFPAKSVAVQIIVSCINVSYVGNHGPFMVLFVPNGVTNEEYKNVELKCNRVKKERLYFSSVREAHVNFMVFQCINNPSPCIGIQSGKADVEIQSSSFDNLQIVQKGKGAGLFLEAHISAFLKIFNSTFKNNKAFAGGSLFANTPRGLLTISLTNVLFSYSGARMFGCAIAIGVLPRKKKHKFYDQSIPNELDFTLRNVTVQNWRKLYGNRYKCTAIEVFMRGGKVTLYNSSFYKRVKTPANGALLLRTLGGKTNVTISRCSLIDNAPNKTKAVAFYIVASNGNAGSVTVTNSLIISNGTKQKAFLVSPKYRIRLVNITVTSFRYGFQVVSTAPKNDSFPVKVYFDNCTFANNQYDLMFTLLDPTSVEVIIKNTIFTCAETIQKSYAIRLNIAPLKNINSSNAVIRLENDTFDSKPSSNFALFFEGKKNLTIRRSRFINCTFVSPEVQKWKIPGNKSGVVFYETATGGISILTNPDKPLKMGCLQSDTKKNTHPLWQYDSHVTFEDTVFENNVGLIAGGVHLSNGFTKFQRCTFQDNFGVKQSGHVYFAYGTGQVEFENCSFLRTKENMSYKKSTFLYSESGGPLKLTNTSMISLVPEKNNFPVLATSSGGYVYIDEKSEIRCSEGSKLLLENATHIIYTDKNNMSCRINVTVLKYSCRSCIPGYYSLQKGISRGLLVNSTVDCLLCPFGANCIETNIAAKPGFWGYPTTGQPLSLQFISCPEHYCQSPLPHSKDYNRCRGNRDGTLCGKCAEGFTETLFSVDCTKTAKCNHHWLWIATIIFTIGLVLYLLIKPPILGFLADQILWYKKKDSQLEDNLGEVGDRHHSDSGYMKITFYFYQVAEILIDGTTESLFEKVPFAYLVVSAFNFQIRTVNDRIGCPFSGLTAVTKELLLSATVSVTMADVLLIYCVHVFINICRRKQKPKLSHYVAVLVEVLLLGYERLAETSLKLMHCVSIGSRKWLFIDGNVQCFQWWQYIFLAYIVMFLIPFILVLYFGSFKLYKSSISANAFLAACIFPLPFILWWSLKEIRKRRESDSTNTQEDSNDVLEVLHGPFRPPSSNNGGTLYWESVLIGRRFVLLACHTFIQNAMLRMVCMTFACFLVTLHHMLKNPYRDPLANKAETLSLSALTMIAAINLPRATMLFFGLDLGPEKSYLDQLEWIEVGALAFIPLLVSLLVTFAFLSQIARFVVFLFKHIRRCWQFCMPASFTDERRPLLDINESDSDSEP